jgi:hypothetical protein
MVEPSTHEAHDMAVVVGQELVLGRGRVTVEATTCESFDEERQQNFFCFKIVDAGERHIPGNEGIAVFEENDTWNILWLAS